MQFNSYRYFTLFLLLLLSLTIQKKIYAQTTDENNIEQQKIESVFQKIQIDFNENKITLDESVLFLVYSIFERSKLPDEYQVLSSNGEPTWVFTRILKYWDSLNFSTKQELMKYGFSISGTLSRPTFLNSSQESAHFKVFYSNVVGDSNAVSTIDENTNGIPDYIESILSTMEHVWSSEVDSMGFTAPPGDSLAGGNSKYDIYVYKITANLFGFASPETLIGNNPNSTAAEKNAYTSYITLRNEYSQFTNHSQLENIQVTAAHEFFHSIQFGYDTSEKSWLMEATAAWMEDEVYDDVNDNVSYLTSWFKSPYTPLDATKAESNNHWYGSWIFFRYISEHLGGQSTIRKIWEKSINHDSQLKDYSFAEINEALSEVNSSYDKAFKDFAVSNLFQTIVPYNYEEAALYPSVKISREVFHSENNIHYSSKRHGSRYIRIFPNTVPDASGLDKIEFTVTPTNPTVKLELVIATKSSGAVNAESSVISSETINYTLQNSSTKDEIYAIIVNLDTNKTDFKLEIEYKGNLVKLNNIADYSYGQLSNHVYIKKQFRETISSTGEPQTDLIITRQNLNVGGTIELIFPNSHAGSAYLSNSSRDIFIIANDENAHKNNQYGYHNLQLKQLAGVFDVTQFPAVSYNKVFFEGNLRNPDFSYSNGILTSDLSAGPPQMILDLTDTDFKISQIVSDGNSFVAVKYNIYQQNSEELISFVDNSLNTFYLPSSDYMVGSLVFDENLAAWSETDNFYSNGAIKAYDFSTNTLKSIRAVNGVDAFSIATASKRVVWWENTGAGTKIKVWESDSTITLRTTFKGLYLDDNGVSSGSFDVPIDDKGVAWMETDFILYYYNFPSATLNTYDLSSYFTDNLNTGYLVKLSGKNIIIEALSSVSSDKLGTYLFKLGDIATGIKDGNNSNIPIKFSLSQNYPNPFNPATTISYQLPFNSKVTIKIYDILGRKITTLVNKKQAAGNYKITFDAKSLASGIYFYRLSAENGYTNTKKMLLLK